VRPVTKVVNLLKEMQAQISKEASDDAAMYDQMACWCETNEKEKTKAISDGQQRLKDLQALIPETAAKAAQLEVDIKQLGKEISQKTSALQEATEIRAKEQEEFRSDEKDMIQSISSLKNAVGVMSKVNKGASLSQTAVAQIQDVLRKHMKQHRVLLQESLSEHDQHQVFSFLEAPAHTAMLQGKTKYDPQSGPIFGILKGMKESFESNLATAQKDEEEAVAQFASLKESKTKEIAAAENLIDTKTTEKAEQQEKNAQGKEDQEDTRVAVKADTDFLMDLKLKCQNADADYEGRVKVRNQELAAVSDTISILSSDESKEQFNKSFKFLQTSQTRNSRSRDRAADVLRKAGQQFKNPKLVLLANSMRLSGFEEIKEKIDSVVEALKAEQKKEVEQKDYCVAEFNENEKQTAEKMDMKGDLETKISTLGSDIESLTEDIAALNEEIATTQKEMKKASQIREGENHAFQVEVTDQRATQAVLKKAVDRLKSFYGFIQKSATKAAQPAEGTYKKNAGAAGVLTMIETLIEESKEAEAEATKSESDSQAAYETYMKDSTAAVTALQKDVANKSESKAKADTSKVAAEEDLKGTVEDLLTLGEYNQELHKQCDFLVKNFDLRQSSRTSEMEALAQAKAIFSGATL